MRDRHSSKKILLTIVALLVVLAGTTGGVIATKPAAPHVAVVRPGANQFTQLSYQGQPGKSALALLKTHAKVVTQDSPYGVYVVSINGVAVEANGKYWMLYVNGQRAQMNAGDYITRPGDIITWKFE